MFVYIQTKKQLAINANVKILMFCVHVLVHYRLNGSCNLSMEITFETFTDCGLGKSIEFVLIAV